MPPDIEEHPAWRALRARLMSVTSKSGRSEAFVLDAWGNLWCSSRSLPRAVLEDIVGTVERALRTQKPPLTRGGRLDRFLAGALEGYARSLAGVYIVFVMMSPDGDREATRALVEQALHDLEALTLSLPRPEGPGSVGGEGAGIA